MSDNQAEVAALRTQLKALTRRVNELELANAALRDFAYLASHDLQEPLRMVTSYTELLERHFGDKLGARGKSYIFFAADGARRTQQLIRDLLAYAKLDAAELDRRPVEIIKVVGEVLRDLAMAVSETEARITCSELPVVTGDPDQLRSVFRNLLGNALKYRGSEPPRIAIDAVLDGETWVFSVRDNGIGIAPRHQERVFKIFQRLHSREEYPGTGIGLAMCKRIVEGHGGRIWFESAEGQGTTFFFTVSRQGTASQAPPNDL